MPLQCLTSCLAPSAQFEADALLFLQKQKWRVFSKEQRAGSGTLLICAVTEPVEKTSVVLRLWCRTESRESSMFSQTLTVNKDSANSHTDSQAGGDGGELCKLTGH